MPKTINSFYRLIATLTDAAIHNSVHFSLKEAVDRTTQLDWLTWQVYREETIQTEVASSKEALEY